MKFMPKNPTIGIIIGLFIAWAAVFCTIVYNLQFPTFSMLACILIELLGLAIVVYYSLQAMNNR
ncbi:hypothetical protein KDK_38430 [Dictyobacter kobayashii]|uniref:Uncharacterized protein n=1 Tax=Dictyobacter kobayashii TaxID=2014872 RepID=A0A402ALQ9_9CHLR|nr:hypothetical protein KDK_38430 [Dictyobacter kobayashii]